jgi:hypothetical protein
LQGVCVQYEGCSARNDSFLGLLTGIIYGDTSQIDYFLVASEYFLTCRDRKEEESHSGVDVEC